MADMDVDVDVPEKKGKAASGKDDSKARFEVKKVRGAAWTQGRGR
jgi:hypothetical protein